MSSDAQSTFNLITDSCCDLPFEVVNQPGVTVIAMNYVIDDVAYKDDLWHESSEHDFFEQVRNGATPTTQSVAILEFRQVFEEAIKTGVPTVALLFTSGMSGSFGFAQLAADDLAAEYPDSEFYLVDSKDACIAEGLIVHEVLRMREQGASAAQVAAWAADAHFFVNNIFMVDDLHCLQRGGRISAGAAMVGSKLDVKPMLCIDQEGKLTSCGVARGRKKGIRHMIDAYKDGAAPNGPHYALIGGSDCPGDVEALREKLLEEDPELVIVDAHIGPVIGSHVGAGMLAMAWWGKDRSEGCCATERMSRLLEGAR